MKNITLEPVALRSKQGTNICWWNAFIQLFEATIYVLIVDEMNKFINKLE